MRCPHCGVDKSDEARFCGACGRAAAGTEPSYKELTGAVPVQAPDLIGREIGGRYRVLSKLGEGGMGAVYRGEQISLKRTIAIKVLRPELSRDPGLVRRFNTEAELAAKLSHPHTVNIYDFGQDADGSLFIAMEYLEGRSLRQAMTQDGPLPPWRALAIVQQIAASLSDAHRHGIVHRDLKPDNVMLTERGKDKDVVRVLDFGIAKLRDDQTVNAMTRAGDLIGTPQYMAPEQIRGEPVDGRTDVYALGAMLYEMVTGRLPFEGPTVMAILSKHLIDAPELPTSRRPDLGLPPLLDGLIMSALAKDPAQRQPSMDRLGDDVAMLYAQLGGPRSAMMPTPQVATTQPQPVAHGFHPTPLPRPSGPPPGVPRTYPPGMMQPLPGQVAQTPPPAYAAPVPMPMPYAATHGGPAPTPPPYPMPVAPAPRSSRVPVIIAVVVVLAAAGGTAGYFLSRPATTTAAEPGGETDPDDPWGGAGGGSVVVRDDTGGDDDEPPEPPPKAPSWGQYLDPDVGWGLRLPPGVSTTPTVAAGSVNFQGLQGGALVVVGAFAMPNQGNNPSSTELDQFANQFATNLGARVTESGYVSTQGVSRYRVVMETGVDRAEARFFIEPHVMVMAYYGRNDGWDARAGERREFFEGVSLPGGDQ